MKRTFLALLAFALLAMAIAPVTQAATISVSPSCTLCAPSEVLVVTVQGSGFDNLTDGGDFTLSWDAAVLQYVGTAVAAPFDTIATIETDVASGTLNRVDVFKSTTGSAGPGFDAATITFNVIGAPGSSSALDLGESLVGWFEPGGTTEYTVTYTDATINVIPLPAAAWLFGSALGLLGWMRSKSA
jgi:hypothetical protein